MAYITYLPYYNTTTYTTATTVINPNTTYYAYIDVNSPYIPHIPFRESLRLNQFKFTDWKKSFK